ncbi:MAG: ABC transporter ATP-binding protein [Elusimicrobiota bacterium]|nr:ABC transporter ATP-binding protein [Elusimicrobiota bacterium]
MAKNAEKILDIKKLSASYNVCKKKIKVLKSVDLYLNLGETIGVAGESGCGKSTLAAAILKIIEYPDGEVAGEKIDYKKGQAAINLLSLTEEEMRKIRGKDLSLVVQDPYSCLNPVIKIGSQLKEIQKTHNPAVKDKDFKQKSAEYLRMVHLADPQKILESYPHQLSGGMLQRVNIAAALLNKPDILISDEPTSSLDVTVQKKIMEMFYELKEEYNLSQIFISHDLNLISGFADRIYILYAGRVVETGPTAEIFTNPVHPYTRALLDALPHLGDAGSVLHSIPGEVLPAGCAIEGCPFAPRCRKSRDICFKEPPPLKEISENHLAECFLV